MDESNLCLNRSWNVWINRMEAGWIIISFANTPYMMVYFIVFLSSGYFVGFVLTSLSFRAFLPFAMLSPGNFLGIFWSCALIVSFNLITCEGVKVLERSGGNLAPSLGGRKIF